MSTSDEQEHAKKSSSASSSKSKSVRFELSPVLQDDLEKPVRKPEKKEHRHKKKKKHHILVDEKDKIIEEAFEEIGESDLMESFGDDPNITNSNDGVENVGETGENEVRTSPRHRDDKKSSRVKLDEEEEDILASDDEAESKSGYAKVEGKVDEEEIEMLRKKLRAKREKKAKKHKKKSSQSEASFSFISGIEISSNSSTSDVSPFPINDDEIHSDEENVDDNEDVNDVTDDVNDDEGEGKSKKGKHKSKKKKKKKSSEDRYFSKAFMSEFIDEDEVNDDDDDEDDNDDDDDDEDIDDNYCDRVPSDDDSVDSSDSIDNTYDEAGICDLPPGWEPRFDYKSKRWYYVDHNTRTTHWKRPSMAKSDPPLDPELYPDPKATAEMFLRNGPPKGKKGVLKTTAHSTDLYVTIGTPRHTDLQKVAARNAKSLAVTEDLSAMSLNNYAASGLHGSHDGMAPLSQSHFTSDATYSKEMDLLYKDIVLSLRSTTQVAYETFEYDPTFGISLTRDEQELRMFYTVYTRRVARPSFEDDLFIKDYAPEAFDHMRKCLRISQDSYMQSWSRAIVPPSDPKILTDIVLLSGDKKYILRAVDHSAAKMIFKNFYTFVNHFHANPSSAIAKIIGLYRIPNMYPSLGFLKELKHMYFIAALNPVAYGYSLDEAYDIKPYKSLTPKNDFVSGDNFKILVENRASTVQYDSTKAKLYISEKDRKHLVKQIERDTKFLAELKLMGYCCIIAVHYTDLFVRPPPSNSMSASSTSFADSLTIDDGDDYLMTPSLGVDSLDSVYSPESPNVMTPDVVNMADRSDPFDNPSKLRKSKVKVKRASSVTPTPPLRASGGGGGGRSNLPPMEPVSLDIAAAKRISRSTDVLISPRHLTSSHSHSSKKSISPGGMPPISPLKSSKPHSRLSEEYYFSESPDGSESSSGLPSPTPSNRAYKETKAKREMSPIADPPIATSSSSTSMSSPSTSLRRDSIHKRLPSPAAPVTPIAAHPESRSYVPKIPIQTSSLTSSSGHSSEKYVVMSPRSSRRELGSPRKTDSLQTVPKLNLPSVQLSPRSTRSPRNTRSPDPNSRKDPLSSSLSSSPSGIVRTPRNLKIPIAIPVSKKCNIKYNFEQ